MKLAEGLSSFYSALFPLICLISPTHHMHGLMAIKHVKIVNCESNKMSHDLMANYDACPTSSALTIVRLVSLLFEQDPVDSVRIAS